jgi:hypothetical protein
LALGAAGLSVDSLSPDALCPPLEETRRAVAARLGNVELDGTWRATYVLVHRQQGDFVTLKVIDPVGAERLERQLPAQGAACAALPAVIALVLERFFVPPEQTQSPGAPAPAESEPAPAPSEPAPTTTSSRAAAPASAAPPATAPVAPASERDERVSSSKAPQSPHSLRFGAELWGTGDWLAPGLRAGGRVGGAYWVGLHAGFDLSSHRVTAFGGTVAAQRAPLALLVERQLTQGSVQWSAGVELLGLLEVASSSGLREADGGTRVVPGAGLRLAAHFLPSSLLVPFAALSGGYLVRAWTPAFQVGTHEVLPPPEWVIGGAVGVDATF